MAFSVLPESDLAWLSDFLLNLEPQRRDFLLDIFEREAPEFLEKIETSLPSLQDFFDWDPRLIQQIIRSVSFKNLAWVIYDRDSSLIELIGENMSHRGRQILIEDIQAVKNERRRRLEEGKITPQDLQRLIRKKKIITLLHAYNQQQRWLAEHGTKK
ncbi:MAG: FliG C-terminal domain-containing protein [bacterium]